MFTAICIKKIRHLQHEKVLDFQELRGSVWYLIHNYVYRFCTKKYQWNIITQKILNVLFWQIRWCLFFSMLNIIKRIFECMQTQGCVQHHVYKICKQNFIFEIRSVCVCGNNIFPKRSICMYMDYRYKYINFVQLYFNTCLRVCSIYKVMVDKS